MIHVRDPVIHQCALTPDIRLFKSGDETQVGERGITLRYALTPKWTSDLNLTTRG